VVPIQTIRPAIELCLQRAALLSPWLNFSEPASERQPPPPQRLLYATVSTLPFVPSFLGLAFLAAILLFARFFNFDQAQAYSLAHFNPALLNETGRNHLKRVSRHQ
jgi:hypothetical protein